QRQGIPKREPGGREQARSQEQDHPRQGVRIEEGGVNPFAEQLLPAFRRFQNAAKARGFGSLLLVRRQFATQEFFRELTLRFQPAKLLLKSGRNDQAEAKPQTDP